MLVAGLAVIAAVALQGSPIGPTPVQGVTLVVDTQNHADALDGFCSLREAVIAADDVNASHNECVGAGVFGEDTITFGPGVNTITLTGAFGNISDAAGLTVDGGAGVTIDGNGSRAFFLESSASVTLNNLTITGGV